MSVSIYYTLTFAELDMMKAEIKELASAEYKAWLATKTPGDNWKAKMAEFNQRRDALV